MVFKEDAFCKKNASVMLLCALQAQQLENWFWISPQSTTVAVTDEVEAFNLRNVFELHACSVGRKAGFRQK